MTRSLLSTLAILATTGCDKVDDAVTMVCDGAEAVSKGAEPSSSESVSAARDLLSPAEPMDCLAEQRGDQYEGPVEAPGGVAPQSEAEAREAVTRFFRQKRIDARSMTASSTILALEEAQERYRDEHDMYRLFDEDTPADWAALGLEQPAPRYHSYRAAVEDRRLLIEAVGNLDTDPFLDRWRGGPANGGGAAQLTNDALDADLYPGLKGQ